MALSWEESARCSRRGTLTWNTPALTRRAHRARSDSMQATATCWFRGSQYRRPDQEPWCRCLEQRCWRQEDRSIESELPGGVGGERGGEQPSLWRTRECDRRACNGLIGLTRPKRHNRAGGNCGRAIRCAGNRSRRRRAWPSTSKRKHRGGEDPLLHGKMVTHDANLLNPFNSARVQNSPGFGVTPPVGARILATPTCRLLS